MLLDRVLKTVRRFKMLDEGDYVLVAVSGGPDSVALMHILKDIGPAFGLQLHAFHLDHRLRPDSSADARFVEELCARISVPLESIEYDVPSYLKKTGFSVEDGARRIRHALLEEAANRLRATKIALGHQADDQVETFLMRLIRGAGLLGLSAIPPVRHRFIRPMIEIHRAEILEYLESIGERYRMDASNEDLSFLRNRIRARLIPEIMGYNPGFKEVVLQTIDLVKEDEALLELQAGELFSSLADVEEKMVTLPVNPLLEANPALLRRILRTAVRMSKGDLQGIEYRHIELVAEGLKEGSVNVDLPDSYRAKTEEGFLVVAHVELFEREALHRVELSVPGVTEVDGWSIAARLLDEVPERLERDPMVAQLDYDLIEHPLVVRSWKPGDYFTPFGLKGRKKLHDFFIDEKVPRRKRLRVPIVESGGRIVWVAGMRIDDRFKVTRRTKRVLELKLGHI